MAVVVPEIIGRNYEVTPEVRNLLETKLDRLEGRLFNDVISVRVVLQVEKYRNICEILIAGKDHDVNTIQESDQSMVDAINAALDHAKQQAQKHHEKLHDHHKSTVDVSGRGTPGPLAPAPRRR
jgi:ribosomal subunit interface protein